MVKRLIILLHQPLLEYKIVKLYKTLHAFGAPLAKKYAVFVHPTKYIAHGTKSNMVVHPAGATPVPASLVPSEP
ncbi:hypothetical protein NPIL_611771 [Nephila pilipes]|uniref:Uncharacterized protein n=1 Tax=Nephila pilipes TaxID=299642 RepID=A0A8X6U1V1_NEPPI|nr:hypothetical protein NPIL_611771 [Nephila pilipes]